MKNSILKLVYRILALYARKVIEKHDPFIIGITGSVGKTSVKEAVYHVLSDHFQGEVRKTAKSMNGEIGIPLTILGYEEVPNRLLWPVFLFFAFFRTFVKKYPKYLVLEMGVEHPGDIKYFGTIVRPNIGIITSTQPVHLINFKDTKQLEGEKISLREIIKVNGELIVNADDQALAKLMGQDKVSSVGIEHKSADYYAEGISIDFATTNFRIVATGQKIAVKSMLLGRQLIYPHLFAYAVGKYFHIQSLEIKKSLEKIKPYPGRMNLIEGMKNTMIIDDTYNSNPTSAKAALDALAAIKFSGRKVAILGNMNELGSIEKEAHQEIGQYAKGRCDLAIFSGANFSSYAEGYGDSKTMKCFANRTELIADINKLINSGDLILVKASQNGNHFEEIVKKLMKNPSEASKILVRQSRFWLNKK